MCAVEYESFNHLSSGLLVHKKIGSFVAAALRFLEVLPFLKLSKTQWYFQCFPILVEDFSSISAGNKHVADNLCFDTDKFLLKQYGVPSKS